MPHVGELLRQEREKKGLSLKDAEKALNIRTAYLKAIEEGRFDAIPGEVYVKGFIRNYGNFLGLDGSQLVAQYREAKQAKAVLQQAEQEPTPPPASAANPGRLRSLLLKLAGVLIIAALGIWYFSVSAPSPRQQPPIAPPSEGVVQTQPAAPPPAMLPPAAPTPPQVASVQVTAKFTGDCWVEVTADGKTIYEGTARKDTTMTWQGHNTVKIIFGNAGAADVTVNGQNLGVQGRPGEVVVKTFTANAVKP